MVAYAPGLDATGPPGDKRDPDPALVQRALEPSQARSALEELRVHAPRIGRPVVAREHYDGVLGQAQLVQPIQDSPDMGVHPRDHPRVRRERPVMRQIRRVAEVRLLLEDALVLDQ